MLCAVTRWTLVAAGPRYSPSHDPDAPNLEIRPLQDAAWALSLGTRVREKTQRVAAAIRQAQDRDSYLVEGLFGRRKVTMQVLANDLDELSALDAPADVSLKSWWIEFDVWIGS
jgi:hypothetical protein